jgi:hypothetical protein
VERYAAPISGEDVFEDFSSPQYRAASFIANDVTFYQQLDMEQLDDLYALSVFYYSTGGDNWLECSQGSANCTQGESWLNPDIDQCSWSWVTCNDAGRVTDIIFSK